MERYEKYQRLLSAVDTPEEPAKPTSGPGMKRNYTQADLDRAVTDIR